MSGSIQERVTDWMGEIRKNWEDILFEVKLEIKGRPPLALTP